jgi:hypothetical protein
MWKKWSWSNLRYYFAICLITLNQDNQYPRQHWTCMRASQLQVASFTIWENCSVPRWKATHSTGHGLSAYWSQSRNNMFLLHLSNWRVKFKDKCRKRIHGITMLQANTFIIGKQIFSIVMPCSLVNCYNIFKWMHYLHLQGRVLVLNGNSFF